MFKKILLIGIIVSFVPITSGCSSSSVKSAEQKMKTYNKQIEYVVEQYHRNIEVAKSVEVEILKAIKGEKEIETAIFSNVTIKDDIAKMRKALEKSISTEIEKDEGFEEQYGTLTEKRKKEIRTKSEENVLETLKVYYFLDSKTGVLEQVVQFTTTNGNHCLLSFYWLEGNCYKVEYKDTGGI